MSCGVHWGCTDIREDLEQEAEKWQAPQFEKNFHSLQAQNEAWSATVIGKQRGLLSCLAHYGFMLIWLRKGRAKIALTFSD